MTKYGDEVIINGPVKFVGDPKDDPENNPGFQLWKKLFIEVNQTERSKRENLYIGYFPPPWNMNDHPEKTLGWFEFQKAMKDDPKYYLPS